MAGGGGGRGGGSLGAFGTLEKAQVGTPASCVTVTKLSSSPTALDKRTPWWQQGAAQWGRPLPRCGRTRLSSGLQFCLAVTVTSISRMSQ